MNRKKIIIFFFISLLGAALFIYKISYAKSRTIDYFPRDQEILTINKDTNYFLNESVCSQLSDLNTKVSRCWNCMGLKNLCPDCCLALTPTSRKEQCAELQEDLLSPVFTPDSGSANPRLACPLVSDCPVPAKANPAINYENYKNYCAAVNDRPGCQEKGCPSDEPKNDGHFTKCSATPSGDSWICNDKDIDELKYTGCAPAVGSGVTDCITKKHGGSNGFYHVSSELDHALCPPGYAKCWEYTMYNDIKKCIDNPSDPLHPGCYQQARAYEISAKNLSCCNQDSGVCCKDVDCNTGIIGARPGYQNNCSSGNCDKRIDWPECQASSADKSFCCDNLDSKKCSEIQDKIIVLIDKMTNGTSFGCFNDISNGNDKFQYDFVAKSNEKVMVIWQVEAKPEYCAANPAAPTACVSDWGTGAQPNTNFYTMIKIFDITDTQIESTANEVYPGAQGNTIMNQKSFVGAFSIFSAAVADKDSSGDFILQQGHRYRVKLYYLLAPLNDYVLRSKITRTQFIVLRIREQNIFLKKGDIE